MKPKPWRSLGKLAVKSDIHHAIKLELGGQDAHQKFLSEQMILNPRERLLPQKDFFTVSYLYTPKLPEGTIGIHSPILKDTHLVKPSEWGNIWVYGMKIIYAGYITRGEFRKNAIRLPIGSRIFQYTKTRTENFSFPIELLQPLEKLFDQAKK